MQQPVASAGCVNTGTNELEKSWREEHAGESDTQHQPHPDASVATLSLGRSHRRSGRPRGDNARSEVANGATLVKAPAVRLQRQTCRRARVRIHLDFTRAAKQKMAGRRGSGGEDTSGGAGCRTCGTCVFAGGSLWPDAMARS